MSILLTLLTVLAWAAWVWANRLPASGFLSAWMPNVGTSLAVIALTLWLIQPFIEEQQRLRQRSLAIQTLMDMSIPLAVATVPVAFDYAQTHLDTFHQPPSDFLGLISMWRDSLATQDYEGFESPDEVPMVTSSLREVADDLTKLENRVWQVDDADLTLAVRDFTHQFQVRWASIQSQVDFYATIPAEIKTAVQSEKALAEGGEQPSPLSSKAFLSNLFLPRSWLADALLRVASHYVRKCEELGVDLTYVQQQAASAVKDSLQVHETVLKLTESTQGDAVAGGPPSSHE